MTSRKVTSIVFRVLASLTVLAGAGLCGILGMGSDRWIGAAGGTGVVFLFALGGALVSGILWFALWVLDLPAPNAHLKTVEESPAQIRVCRRLFIGSMVFVALAVGLYGLGYLYDIYHASEFHGSVDPGRRDRTMLMVIIAGSAAVAVPVMSGILWQVSARRWRGLRIRKPGA